MNQSFSKRAVVRLVSFAIAAFFIIGGAAVSGYSLAGRYRDNLEYTYQRALSDLSDYLTNIESTLQKGEYAATAPQQQGILNKLMHETGGAKSALAQLPVSSEELSNINKFIAQTGDFAAYLSASIGKGNTISSKEWENYEALSKYAKTLNEDIKDLQARIDAGGTTIGKVLPVYQQLSNETQALGEPSFNSGFHDMNEGFTDYPTLIYDGPFSDHITPMKPKFLEGKEEVTAQTAKTKAASFFSIPTGSLAQQEDIGGNLACYVFTADDKSVSVSKRGGYINSMLCSREVGETKLNFDAARVAAVNFLNSQGIYDMKESYYAISNGVCTINFAHQKNNVTYYSDLIKVGVAMDNGDIVSYHATGYLMNHHERELPEKTISMDKAMEVISPRLDIKKQSMAMIPSKGLSEVLCYEFECEAENGDRVLVYLNAKTGLEEQIYILIIEPGGVLVI